MGPVGFGVLPIDLIVQVLVAGTYVAPHVAEPPFEYVVFVA